MLTGFIDFVRDVEALETMRIQRDIDKSNINWTVGQMFKMFQKGRFDFDIEFQRALLRWNRDKQCMLVDSVVRGYPIPAVYAVKMADGTYVIIDGKQRLSNLFSFKNDEYHLVGLDPIPFEELDENKKPTGIVKYYDINGKLFSELPECIQDAINDYSVTVYYLEAGSGGELSKDITRSVFKRLNNGVALSRKEMNIANCTDLTQFTALGQHEFFQTILSEKAKASRNQITTLMKMFMVLHNDLEDISFGPDDMTEAMEDTITTEDDRQELTAILDKMMDVYGQFADDDKTAKAIRKRWTAETHLVSLAPWFKKAIEEDIPDDMMADFLAETFATKTPISPAYTEFSRAGSGKTHAIVGRDAEIARAWREFFVDSVADFEEDDVDDAEEDVEEGIEDEEEVEVVEVVESDDSTESEVSDVEYHYGMRSRGAAPGAQPDGFLCFEDDETGKYHNILTYDRELTDEEVNQYELDRID